MADDPKFLLLAEIGSGPVPAKIGREHLTRGHNIAIRIPPDDAGVFVDLSTWMPAANLMLHTPAGVVVVWRLAEWQPWVVVEHLATQVADVFGGEVVWQMPLPYVSTGVAVINHNPQAVHTTRRFRDALDRLIDAAAADAERASAPMSPSPSGHAGFASPNAFRPAADVRAASTRWLWPGVIPLGALTLLAGKPKRGKSQIAIAIASIVSTGGTWPTGERCQPGNILLMETEDGAARIKSRIEAAGGDVSRISIRSLEDGALNLADGGTDAVEAESQRIGNVRLVIVSPVNAHFGVSGTADDASVRTRLAPLLGWAAQNDVAVLAITHPRKDARVLEDYFSGADGFRRAARAAFVAHFAPKDEPGGALTMTCVAQTDGPDDLVLRYGIEGVTLPGGVQSSRVVWYGPPETEHSPRQDGFRRNPQYGGGRTFRGVPQCLDGTAGTEFHGVGSIPDGIPADRNGTHDENRSFSIEEWLRSALADGPQSVADLLAEGEAFRWPQSTIYDAKKRLGIRHYRDGGVAWWKLPDFRLPTSDSAEVPA